MKLLLVSDTHGHEPVLECADVLVHAGDISMSGSREQVAPALDWLAGQAASHVILTPGNHDFLFEREPEVAAELCRERGIIVLDDSGVTIDGVTFWGSPITPWFFDWAFNRRRGADIRKHWSLIPSDTDVLVTHGPPLGVLDRNLDGECCGCGDLELAVKRVGPRIHVFGHIHEGYGTMVRMTEPGTDFYNASFVDASYRPGNAPHVVEV